MGNIYDSKWAIAITQYTARDRLNLKLALARRGAEHGVRHIYRVCVTFWMIHTFRLQSLVVTMVSFSLSSLLFAASYLSLQASARLETRQAPLWMTLPPTPTLPGNPTGNKTLVNGIEIWHAEFGPKLDTSCLPVLMLHGGFGSSNYWGSVVRRLMKKHHVIVMDARGQGRSTMDSTPYSFDLYAQDGMWMFTFLWVIIVKVILI